MHLALLGPCFAASRVGAEQLLVISGEVEVPKGSEEAYARDISFGSLTSTGDCGSSSDGGWSDSRSAAHRNSQSFSAHTAALSAELSFSEPT